MNQDLLLLSPTHSQPHPYDPFHNPPTLALANLHAKATRVGLLSSKEDPQFCPCCDNVVNKQPLPVCFADEELLGLGVGYALYFKVAKYFMAIMVVIFFVSGSAIYFLMVLRCDVDSACYTLFGIPIINISVAERTNLNRTELANMATCLLIFLLVLYCKTLINEDIRVLTNKKMCPSLYTVMLQNVPTTDDQSLSNWVHQCFGEQPLLINWAYDAHEFLSTYRRKQDKVIRLNKTKIKLRKIEESIGAIANPSREKALQQLRRECESIRGQIEQCSEVLQKYGRMEKQCEKIGTVFVSFERVETVNSILETQECSFLKSVFKSAFSFIRKSKLSLNGQVIIVNKAPAPLEVFWENLEFSYLRSILFELLFLATMVVTLLVAFKVLLFFMDMALGYKIEREKSGHFELLLKGSVMSLIILVINSLMRLVIEQLASAKKYYSHTKYQSSYCLYYCLFYILNACCLVYMVHGSNTQDTPELLLADIHLIVLANAFSEPLYKLVDPTMWYRALMRCYLSRLSPQDNPYTQEYVNRLWEGHSISNADNYQYITRVLFVTTWFAAVAPVGVLLSLLALVLDYWISKAFLARVYRTPENVSQEIAKSCLMGLELLPLVYICGVVQFSYKVSSGGDVLQFLRDFLHYGITTVVMLFSIAGYIILCRKPVLPHCERTYSQSRLGFGYNYETTNPITKLRGEINYLCQALKGSSEESSRVISELLAQSKRSPSAILQRREEVNRIKMTLHRRLSQENRQVEMSEYIKSIKLEE